MLDDKTALATLAPKIRYLVRRYAPHQHPVLDIDDVRQDATIGAMQALQTYDPGKSTSLPTYAERRIVGEIQEGYRRVDDLTRRERTLGMPAPTFESFDRPRPALKNQRIAGGFWHLYDTLAAPVPPPDGRIASQEVRAALERACARLPLKWRLILHWYYAEELTMAAIGVRLGLTESRISQMHTAALARLRPLLTDWDDEERTPPRRGRRPRTPQEKTYAPAAE